MLAAVPATVLKVGVFVDAPVDEVERRIDELGLDRAQLHGDESPAHFGGLDRRLIRVLRVRDEASFEGAAGWSPALWLYDAYVEGFGGGGVPAPWSLIADARAAAVPAGGWADARERRGRRRGDGGQRRRRRQRRREQRAPEGSAPRSPRSSPRRAALHGPRQLESAIVVLPVSFD